MLRQAALSIRQLPAVLAVVVLFPLIDIFKSAGALSLTDTPMDVNASDFADYEWAVGLNRTQLFDYLNTNASRFFPRTFMDSVGPMRDDAAPHVARVHIPVGYLIGLSIGTCALLFSIVGIALLHRRKAKIVLLPDHSIFGSQNENRAWDSLSFSYGGGDSEIGKNPWESLSDDSYLASLDEVIAQRASVIAFQKRASAIVVPHPMGETANPT